MKLTISDIAFLKNKNISVADIEEQIQNFKKGTQYLDIVKPASLNDGILDLSEQEKAEIIKRYDSLIKNKVMTKFVPASGAATRMFKNLYTYLEDGVLTDYIQEFIDNIKSFAFYNELVNVLLLNAYDIDELLEKKEYHLIISFLLEEKGLNYGSLPKGLLSFHKKNNKVLTPIDEHIAEGDAYLGDSINLIFTISEEYTSLFKEKIKQGIKQIGRKFDYRLCYQQATTDTVAVDKNYEIVRDEQNQILMRPGGHGSLISNLNEIDADIIFIKNIDNVVSQSLLANNIQYKKILAGVLFNYQEQIFNYQKELEKLVVEEHLLEEMYSFLSEKLGTINKKWLNFSVTEKRNYLKIKMNRPLRVCGMVKNTGEPGGGPFWVANKNEETLQIAESSQINLKSSYYKTIFNKASYFNPVDLVCAVKNYKGDKFKLMKFIDKKTFFISQKSYRGKDILALEHPGLWNGGMSDWNTVFVAVPSKTFAPVKMVNDLLKKEHQ